MDLEIYRSLAERLNALPNGFPSTDDGRELKPLAKVDAVRCTGCGVCVIHCSTGALGLARRPEAEIKPVPRTHAEWGTQRAAARSL